MFRLIVRSPFGDTIVAYDEDLKELQRQALNWRKCSETLAKDSRKKMVIQQIIDIETY